MPINVRQVDNVDTLPPASNVREIPPWQSSPVRLVDWRIVGVLCLFLLLACPLAWLMIGRDIRAWLDYGWGGKAMAAIFALGFIYAIGLIVRHLILIEQPGGFKVAIWNAHAPNTIPQLIEVQNTFAGTAYRGVAAQTISYPSKAEQLPAPQIVEAELLDDGDPPDPFELALANVPRLIDLEYIIDQSPGAMCVPLGTDHAGAARWLDLRKGILHVGIFGSSGAGKDNLLESWFLALAKNNSPDRVQFAVLDGKGHWMKPMLNNLAHMWMPPAGGIGDEGQRALEHTLKAIQAEAARRGKLVFGANCDTMEMYIQKTGENMPYLVVMISDVMGNVVNDVDRLLVDLVSKARALGIRVFVSMQTPTKQNTQWRTNLSTVLAAQMQQPSNDAPALGLTASDMQFPPSRLPDPQSRPGLFSVRNGRDQFLIQAPLVRKPFLNTSIADLPIKAAPAPRMAVSASGMPRQTVAASVPGAIIYPASVKSTNGKIAFLLKEGYSYRQIERELSVSHATIAQVNRALKLRSATP